MKSRLTVSFILVSIFSIVLSAQVFARQESVGGQASALNVETYDQLVKAIRQARDASDLKIQQEKVRLAWQTGKLIDEHILKNAERAEYGKQVIPRLAKDLDTNERELYYMLEFARSYPILPTSPELTWSDYRELLNLNDPEEREQLAVRAQKNKWDIDRIRQEIKRVNAAKKGIMFPEEILHATPGKPGAFRVVKAKVGPYEGELALDLGFSTYYQPGELKAFKEGDVIFTERIREGYSLSRSQARPNDLYTYRAYVVKVIDGDTFTAIVDLGFDLVTEQKLRLRGLDAPELDTPEGQKAKAFLDQKLKLGAPVMIRTEKSDKYDRYLADVFVDGKYLNEELVKQKLAVAVQG